MIWFDWLHANKFVIIPTYSLVMMFPSNNRCQLFKSACHFFCISRLFCNWPMLTVFSSPGSICWIFLWVLCLLDLLTWIVNILCCLSPVPCSSSCFIWTLFLLVVCSLPALKFDWSLPNFAFCLVLQWCVLLYVWFFQKDFLEKFFHFIVLYLLIRLCWSIL